MKKQKVCQNLLKIVITVILAYTMYVQMICNTDDAATYTYMYKTFELGATKISLKDWLNPWFLSSAIVYLLDLGKTGIEKSLIYLNVWYGICVYLTLSLVTKGRKRNWILILAAFILLPSEMTNKYHLFVTISALFLLLLADSFIREKKIWKLMLISVCIVYNVLFTNDKMLFVLYIGGTVALGFLIKYIQAEDKRKKVYCGMLGCTVLVMLLSIVNVVAQKIIGENALGEWNGYGGSEYLNWIDFETFLSKGIPSVFNSLLRQWNAVPKGGMMQINSFYWIVRIVLVFLAIVAFISRWHDIIKENNNISFIDRIATLCTTVVLLVNSLNGMVWYYDIDNAPINRYASVCWFLLVIILVRWLDEKNECIRIVKNINSDHVIMMICLCVIIGNIYPFFNGRTEMTETDYAMEVDYLTSHREEYHYGLADMWISDCITAKTNGEIVVLPGSFSEDKLVRQTSNPIYNDGGNCFNYLISDISYPLTITDENVNNYKGDYVGIYSNGDTIYRYDYDIRFEPKVIMETVGGEYYMTDSLTYYIELPIGTSRIEITSQNRDNVLISIEENEMITNVIFEEKGDNIIYAELTAAQNVKAAVTLSRKEEIETGISKIDVRRLQAAIDIDVNSRELFLQDGKYIITFDGENIDEMDIQWENCRAVEQLTDGRKKRRYSVEVNQQEKITFSIQVNGAQIDRIYYENKDLFGEEDENETE